MKKLFLLSILGTLFCACSKKQEVAQSYVEGHIANAINDTLYFEHITLDRGAVIVDSLVLTEDGAFTFAADTTCSPEFYRLRIKEQFINLALDSIETVNIEAELPNMAFGYQVKGSATCETIRQLVLKLSGLERAISNASNDRNYTLQERGELIEQLVEQYKQEVKSEFINNSFASAASYYACFQTLNSRLLFNPQESKSDFRWMQAVANAWYEQYPTAARTQNLVNIVNECRRFHAKPTEIVLDIDNDKVRELGIIDITLPDAQGNDRTLSDLQGHVVLLDFTAYGASYSPQRTIELRQLYDKYHNRGLEIYQVSLDTNRHLWQQRVQSLPWINVYCAEGFNSDIVNLYTVSQLPHFFLIDRNCDLQARMENITDLEQAIEQLL